MNEPSEFTGSEADVEALRAAHDAAQAHGTHADIDRAMAAHYWARVQALLAEKRRFS